MHQLIYAKTKARDINLRFQASSTNMVGKLSPIKKLKQFHLKNDRHYGKANCKWIIETSVWQGRSFSSPRCLNVPKGGLQEWGYGSLVKPDESMNLKMHNTYNIWIDALHYNRYSFHMIIDHCMKRQIINKSQRKIISKMRIENHVKGETLFTANRCKITLLLIENPKCEMNSLCLCNTEYLAFT